jgi:hypothetical protein
VITDAISLALWLRAMKRNGYKVFEGGAKPFNLNIVGFRSEEVKLDKFNDWISVVYRKGGQWAYQSWRVTTLPGKHYLISELLNAKGCAILAPGQYLGAYQIGKHRGMDALVQVKDVSVYRDGDKDSVIDYRQGDIQTGLFGINIHRGGFFSQVVGKHSAGCQVFQRSNDFAAFMNLCKMAAIYWGNSFTYTLLEEKDMRED